MDVRTMNANARLKLALFGTPDVPLVFLGNFEVEDKWAGGEPGLPRVSFSGGAAIVNRMEEFALTLAGAGDAVVLKQAPDPGFLAYLDELGLDLPRICVAGEQDPGRTVTEDALADESLLRELGLLAGRGYHLAPHGVSELEQRLAREAGLPLAAPSAEVCKTVNSKLYSRTVADAEGLRQPAGWACARLPEFLRAVEWASRLLRAGLTVVVKDGYGVSGKGILVIDDQRRLDQLVRMIRRRVERAGDDRVGVVVEEWVAKRADLNYQFTISRDGAVRFDFVKEALTEGGVHKGHRIPARLSADQVAELEEAARRLGGRLHADGYFGVVGVDALVEPRGGIHPVIEINARNNMSTYQAQLQERFVGAETVALARHYPLRLTAPLPFDALRAALGDLLFDPAGGAGFLVNNYATVNAGAAQSHDGFDGRLYGLVVAATQERMEALDRAVADRLKGAFGV